MKENMEQLYLQFSDSPYTETEIQVLIIGSIKATERGILRLRENISTINVSQDSDVEFINRLSRWILGMNDSDEVVYPPKSVCLSKLSQRDRANILKVFSPYLKRAELPIEKARSILLKNISLIASYANMS